MAVKSEFESILDFEDWYDNYRIDPRTGVLNPNGHTECVAKKFQQFDYYKREHDARTANYWKYEKVADAAVVTERPDLPNVSSGEGAGFLRKIARGIVQHTPNVTVTSIFDDDNAAGILATWICKSKIIGDDEYSNSMQQLLYATMVRAAALGFDCVIPQLLQNSMGTWYIQYDNINYRDVFPEPGVKDVRRATKVFVRRYLTRGEVHQLIKTQAVGWDVAALKALLQTAPVSREYTDHQSRKHHVNSDAYEIITEYTNSGDPFLTWSANTKMLLRIEKNKHLLKEHPVFFFVPEYDGEQPFGRSLLSLIYGRQEFQDWFLNGAMKLWRLNIEPPIIGYGVVNAVPNLGPGKYTSIPNPNAKIEPFQVNSNTLNMFGQISTQNAGNMSQLIGSADMGMATQQGNMSQTPQGVEAQQQMVDVMTNNYQKALEAFFSRYCSYALTIYFQELKNVKALTPSADARKQLVGAGLEPKAFIHEKCEIDGVEYPDDGTGLKNGELKADFKDMAVLYFVKTVPGSLVELEDEKQMRLLNQMFIPLSQAMPAIAQSGDRNAMANAVAAMQFIVNKQIELSGSNHSQQLQELMQNGKSDTFVTFETKAQELESKLGGTESHFAQTAELTAQNFEQVQQQIKLLGEGQAAILQRLGVQMPPSGAELADSAPQTPAANPQPA